MTLLTLIGDQSAVDLVLGWRRSAYDRLRREGLDREAAIAGANAEATKWVEEFTGETFDQVDGRKYAPPRPLIKPWAPPAPAASKQLTLGGSSV